MAPECGTNVNALLLIGSIRWLAVCSLWDSCVTNQRQDCIPLRDCVGGKAERAKKRIKRLGKRARRTLEDRQVNSLRP